MEGWQKMLNEVLCLLRLTNGFANVGRIPSDVVEAGTEQEYREMMAAKKPSQPHYVYDRSSLLTHAVYRPALKARDMATERFDWELCFCVWWARYMYMTLFTCRIVSRWRVRRAKLVGSTYYKQLLYQYTEY